MFGWCQRQDCIGFSKSGVLLETYAQSHNAPLKHLLLCCPICRAPMRWVHRHGITQYLYFPAMTVRLSLQEAAAADCGEGGCCLCGPAGCRQQQAHRAQQAGGQHQGVCAPQHKAPARGTPWRGCRRLGCCWWRPAPWRHEWVVTAGMPLSCPMTFSDCVCNDATDVPRGVFDVQQPGCGLVHRIECFCPA